LDRLALVQIDSVNVLVRSHYLPLFSRLGAYDRDLLDRWAYTEQNLFEYWGHVASLIHVDLQPLLRWRMARTHLWPGLREFAEGNHDLIEFLHGAVLADGPASAGDLDATERKKGPWWGWGESKRALEHLFHGGRVGALRRTTFERVYCDPSLAVPAEVLARPTPTDRDALVGLLERSARAHGVGTATDLADYFRLPIKEVRPLLAEMAHDGVLQQVQVGDWPQPAYLHPEAKLPRWIRARALVSPFDSVMWERDRVERLFGFNYRIEIYVPKPKRTFGYYVLPFLLGDRYVARVDLKADRANRKLLVQAAHAEPGHVPDEIAPPLADELELLATWLDLDAVVVTDRGDLAPALTRATAR
jgi:uncharacterized protein YcaQ